MYFPLDWCSFAYHLVFVLCSCRSTTEGRRKNNDYLAPYTSVDDQRFEVILTNQTQIIKHGSHFKLLFQFLQQEFLAYLATWKESVSNREGFTKQEKNKMFLTHQTYKGLLTTGGYTSLITAHQMSKNFSWQLTGQITHIFSVKSMVDATQYLLGTGVPMILSYKFCQDPLEEHFGRHRALGIRADNPTLWSFGYIC